MGGVRSLSFLQGPLKRCYIQRGEGRGQVEAVINETDNNSDSMAYGDSRGYLYFKYLLYCGPHGTLYCVG